MVDTSSLPEGHLSFRLPGELNREVKRLAEIDRRSVSKEVIVALEEFVKRRNSETASGN